MTGLKPSSVLNPANNSDAKIKKFIDLNELSLAALKIENKKSKCPFMKT